MGFTLEMQIAEFGPIVGRSGIVVVPKGKREAVKNMLEQQSYIRKTYLGDDQTTIGFFIRSCTELRNLEEMEYKISEIVFA